MNNDLNELTALNKDSRARKPPTVTVPYKKPPPPRPVVDFIAPGDDTTVEDSDYQVRFVVKSESPLNKVELWRGNEPLPNWILAALLHSCRSLLRRFTNMSIPRPCSINSSSGIASVYRRIVGITLVEPLAIYLFFSLSLYGIASVVPDDGEWP